MRIIDRLENLINNIEESKDETQLLEIIQTYKFTDPILYNLIQNDLILNNIIENQIIENVMKPFFNKKHEIKNIYNNVLNSVKEIIESLEIEYQLNWVIYFGVGSGAGWFTQYNNEDSILIGVENLVILDWIKKEIITSLLAHELGHFIQSQKTGKVQFKNIVLNKVYNEGFAMYYQKEIIKSDEFPELETNGNNLKKYVMENKISLFQELNMRLQNNDNSKDLFGSWERYQGYLQVGYYLSYLIIEILVSKFGEDKILNCDEETFREIVGNVLNK